jgi:hypothetical protein
VWKKRESTESFGLKPRCVDQSINKQRNGAMRSQGIQRER